MRCIIKNIIFWTVIVMAIGLTLHKVNNSSDINETFKKTTKPEVSGIFDQTMFKSDAEWKKELTFEQYRILREAGTEIPFTGELNYEKRKGTYYSHGCDQPIFRSEQKYESSTGWPSFWTPINETAVVLGNENGLNDNRIEVLDKCGGHLGHVFDDGPEPTGKRYCMNSTAMYFIPDNK